MRRAHQRPNGYAIGIVLIVLVLIMMMGGALVYLGTHNLDQIRTSERQTALRHTADGGLHEMLDLLYQDSEYGQDQTASSSGVFSSSQGATRYSWTFDPSSATPWSTNNLEGDSAVTGYGGRTVPPGCALLFVSAEFDGASNQAPVVVGSVTTNRFPYAVASDGVIELDDVSSIIPGQGHLLSNKVGGLPNIKAGLVEGMTFSRDGLGSILVQANSGPKNFNQPEMELPDLPIQDIIASWSTAGFAGAHPYGGAADYQFSGNVTASSKKNGELTIDGVDITPPATIYVQGNLKVNGGMSLLKGIHFFCTGDFTVNGSLEQITLAEPFPVALYHGRRSLVSRKWVSPTPTPTPSPSPSPPPGPGPFPGPVLSPDSNFIFSGGQVRFNGASSQSIHILCVDGIRQNGSSNMKGLFYVRNGDFDVNGNSQFTGVVITRSGSVTTDGNVEAKNTDVTYDPSVLLALHDLNLEVKGRARTLSWWIEK